MWTVNRPPARPHRTESVHSVHSVASVHSASRSTSMSSPHMQQRSAGGYESDQSSDTANEDELANFPMVPSNNLPPMWQSGRQQSGSAVTRLSQKFAGNVQTTEITAPPRLRSQAQYHQDPMANSPADDDSRSRSSTLEGEEQDFEFPEKTPTSLPRRMDKTHEITLEDKVYSASPSHVPGPLESQLASLMSKVMFMERSNPTVSVTPEDYAELTADLKALREEKKTWQKRHEALYALRDEDVENNIKIRGMLAKARRELEGMTKLRDEDLINVQVVRSKLADATRKLEKLEVPAGREGGRVSPSRARPGSMMMERRGTLDLFAAAKAAALEQRALELEHRNSDLLSQIEILKGGANIEDLNRMTAHEAWKGTVRDQEAKLKAKDAEISRLRSGATTTSSSSGAASGTGVDWHRMEAIHEDHASYREKMGGKMQALRSEKEALQKELHRKEDENHALEVKVQSLQRQVSLM